MKEKIKQIENSQLEFLKLMQEFCHLEVESRTCLEKMVLSFEDLIHQIAQLKGEECT
jgi:hypothetical protein